MCTAKKSVSASEMRYVAIMPKHAPLYSPSSQNALR
jgi:hypothetical protein